MSSALDFTLEEIAAAVRGEILRACIVAGNVASQRQRLLPASVRLSARLIGSGSPRDPDNERFRLSGSGAVRAAAETVEFHWKFDALHDIRIVRAQPQQDLVQG
jgi:hypothetical protein